ncbi:MAG TPA: hypothetical protein VEX37_07360 [Thermomicrobiales bacterium]|nr:hypothetical protein [Thermomicrobiales bacterium]
MCEVDAEQALAAWSEYLGADVPLLLVRNPDRARKLLMRAFGIADKEPVGIPVNTRRTLSEAVKRSGGTPLFVELDADLNLDPASPGLEAARLVWAEPVAGMAPPFGLPGATLFVDYGFTLPAPLADGSASLTGSATLWGLHLSGDEHGALIAFTDAALYEAARASFTEDDAFSNFAQAVAQCERLSGEDGLAVRLLAVDAASREGMEAGAGLPMAPAASRCALPFGLAVRVLDEADLATFISYVRNENVDLDWLPEIQPMFYVAYQVTTDRERTLRSAAHLARWIVAPLGPDFVDDEVTHAVLGILKAAEYTGVRWYTDPERAQWYGDLMFEWYGPTHDAFRVQFDTRVETRVAAD